MDIRLFATLLSFVVASGCGKPAFEYKSDFDRSYAAWQTFKKTSGNSYRYEVVWASWAGIQRSTTITVKDGIVVERIYKQTYRESWDPNAPLQETGFTEEEGEINSHEEGAPGITMDEVYQKAKNHWLKKRPDVKVIFETKNDGMISTCGFIPDGCADDCFNGITIARVEAL